MSKGKYAARAAKRREVVGLETERDKAQHTLQRTQAELEVVKAALDEERARIAALRKQLQSQIDVESVPRVVELEQTVTRLREERDAAIGQRDYTLGVWERIQRRFLYYISAFDPAKPGPEECLGILAGMIDGKEFKVLPANMVPGKTSNDAEYAKLRYDIARSRGRGRRIK